MPSWFTSLKKFWQENKLEVLVLGTILLVALLLRLWKIDGYMTFLGDEGRDVRVVRNILRGDPAFIGPQTSIGNMYLGPLYYYMMAPSLFLSGLNPVGPAVMNALLGTLTILLTWWVGRTWFNRQTGLIASLLFALSPVAIIYSRSSWNPNPMPLFALICLWGAWQVWRKWKLVWLQLAAISLAFALQMHYLGLLLIPTLGFFWLLTGREIWKDLKVRRSFLRHTFLGILWFALLMSPLVLFDLKHSGQNFNAFKAFLSDRQTTINLNPARSDRFLPATESVVAELLLGRQLDLAGPSAFIIALLSIWAFLGKPKRKIIEFLKMPKDPGLVIIFVWIGLGILGLGIYKQHIYAHYFGFLFPAVYLLIGYLLSFLWSKHLVFKLAGLLSLAFLVFMAISNSPLKYAPNYQMARTQKVVEEILQESGGAEFNFGLIAKQNYDESYRYFFEAADAPLVRGEERIVDLLMVVCEDGDACQPLGNPAWQIAVFGPASIDREWKVDHIRLYKLVHTPQN